MLEVKRLVAGYGKLVVLRDVSLAISPGSVTVVLGVNGSGKSTLLRGISGLATIFSGGVTLDEKDIAGMQPYEVAKLGIAHCLEGRRVFPFMSVDENLEVAAYASGGLNRHKLSKVFSLFPVLKERRKQRAELRCAIATFA
jgi:branched-chain amino acid transport system ATP-binding protein